MHASVGKEEAGHTRRPAPPRKQDRCVRSGSGGGLTEGEHPVLEAAGELGSEGGLEALPAARLLVLLKDAAQQRVRVGGQDADELGLVGAQALRS